MVTLPRAYLAATIVASLATGLALLAGLDRQSPLEPPDLALAAILAALMVCAQLFPIQAVTHRRRPLDCGVIFAAALLFQPGLAVLVVVTGALLAEGVRSALSERFAAGERVRIERQASVVIGRTVLQAAAGGTVLAAGGWTAGEPQAVTPSLAVTVAMAAVAIWLVGALVATLDILVGTRLPLHRLRPQTMTARLLVDSLPHFALGLVAALVAERQLWALPLVLLPAVAWYRAIGERGQRWDVEDFVESLADTVDARDRHTVEHSRRVARYARQIATELGLPKSEVELVARAARVHDVGNITIDRATLVRDDTLTGEEWRSVRRHPVIGSDLLLRFSQYVATAPLVRHHHERVDGAGYPDGLFGERIPLGARIIAVADALDAMASTRPYRPALPADAIRAELTRQRGRQWDGAVVDAVLRLAGRGEIVLPGVERLRHYVAVEASDDEAAGPATPSSRLPAIPPIPRTQPERTALEMQLMHQVFHDALTGLPNRALFMDRLEHALSRIRRSADAVAVVFIDLDNFKAINDSWGHQTGDQVLIEIARRLEGCLRPGDTVARLAGDELTLLVENIRAIDDAVVVARRVLEALDAPIRLVHESARVSASLGIAFSATGRETAGDLLHNADVAMYRAKKDGKNGYAIFEPGMRNDAAEMVEMKHDIALAIERGELRVLYQPKALLDSGRIAGVEALVRWQHPVRGLILPAEFLPASEHTGIVTEIDQQVLRDACRQIGIWRLAQPGGPPLVASVNLSARSFANPRLPDELAALLHEFRLDPRALLLEVTEDVAMADPDAAMERFARLKELGIQLAIDNFGAGSSSLSYLKRFPVDMLKIARAFVDGLGYDPGDTASVRAIIAFASTLRRSVAAEGIETAEQFFQLRGLGCEQGQGNHLAPPMTREAVTSLIGAGTTLPIGRVGRGMFAAPPGAPAQEPASATSAFRAVEALS